MYVRFKWPLTSIYVQKKKFVLNWEMHLFGDLSKTLDFFIQKWLRGRYFYVNKGGGKIIFPVKYLLSTPI